MGTALKTDVFREHHDEYAMPRVPTLIRTGPGRYLSVTGTGSPEGGEFRRRLGALYGTAYTIKFASKKSGKDFKVGIMEGLWWTARGGSDFLSAPKGKWHWKLLIRVPDFVKARDVAAALKSLRAKRRETPDVKLETLREGRVVQMLHVGAYAEEGRSIAAMDEFIRAKGMHYRGAHHEIYLSDPRRVAQARLRTILRHSVA